MQPSLTDTYSIIHYDPCSRKLGLVASHGDVLTLDRFIAGCLARLFTTATEVGDNLISAGFALALVLNAIMGVQM